MLKLQLENSTTLIYSVQDLLRLNYGYQRTKLNNKRKPRKTEKSIKSLIKSLRVLETWELVLRLNQDSHTKEVNHSHKVEFQADISNNINNHTDNKEAVDT